MRAPYERGETAAQRQVKSQAERDLEVLALEDLKGPMLDDLDALAADDSLDTASARKVQHFRGWVESARSAARLDELVELFRQAGIRPRPEWHGEAAAELGSAYDGRDQGAEDGYPRAIEAPPGRSVVDYAAELATRTWILEPHGTGLCHVVQLNPHGYADAEPEECVRRAARVIPGGAVCDSCHRALTTQLARRRA